MKHFPAGLRSTALLASDRAEAAPSDNRATVAAADLVRIDGPAPQANQVPVVDLDLNSGGIDAQASYIENDAPTALGSAIWVADPDFGKIGGAIVRITNPVAGDLLSIIGRLPSGIIRDPDSTATELRLTGYVSAATYATALGRVGYSNTGDNPRPVSSEPYRYIAVTVNDGNDDSATATLRMTVFGVNDAPSGTDAAYTLYRNATYTLTADKFGFTDVDGNSFLGIIATTLPSAGTLYYDSDGPGGAAPVAVTAGQAIYDLAPGHILYAPALNGSGAPYASFTFQVVDNGPSVNGNVGGPIDRSPNTITFNVTPQDDPTPPVQHIPVVDLNINSGGVDALGSYIENDGPSPIGPAVSVFDVDGDAIVAALVRITNPVAGDLISIAGTLPAGITIDPSSTATQLKLIGYATAAAYTAALQQIGYSNTGENPRPVATEPYRYIAVSVSDGHADSATATMRVTVFGSNDAPSGADATYTFNQDTSYALTADKFAFSDPEGDAFGGVRINTLPTAGALYYDADGPGGAAALAVTVGQTVSDFAPGHFYYTPAPGGSGTPYTSFTFQVRDSAGGTDPSPNTIIFNVTGTTTPPVEDPANHRPVVDMNTAAAGVGNATAYVENASPSRIGSAISVVDNEGAPITGATVTITNPAAGDLVGLMGSLPAGITLDPGSTATVLKLVGSASGAAYAAALAQIGYSNTGDDPTVSGTNANRYIEVKVNDGNADSLPATVQVTTSGINDAATGTDASYSVAQGATFALTADKFGFVDAEGNGFLAVTITTLPGAGALWFDEDGSGGFGPEEVSAGQFIFASYLGGLTYKPGASGSGYPYASFTFQVWDDGGTANGGKNFDLSPNKISFNVAPPNSPPMATNLSTAESYVEDTRMRLSAITVTDTYAGDTITATLTLSDPAAGKLSIGTSGTVTATFVNGVWTASGALADVNALLAKVQFKPAADFNAGFSIATSVTDGLSAPITGTKAFTGTAVNDAPSGADSALTIVRGVNHVVTLSEFGFTDAVEGNAFTGVTVSGQPAGGRLLLDGAKLTAGQLITAADIAAGKLAFETAPGTTKGPTGSFAFQVHDDGGTANGGTDTDQTPNMVTYTIVKPADTATAAGNQMARAVFVPGGDAILPDSGSGDAIAFDGAVTRAMLIHQVASNAAMLHFDEGGSDDFAALVDALPASASTGDLHGESHLPAIHAEPQHLHLLGADWG
ncbi:MAG: Ig-like domain-containing protein [Pseudomonadota bacterium]